MAFLGDEVLILQGPTGVTDQSTAGNDATYNGSMGVTADTGAGGVSAFDFDGSTQWMNVVDGYTNTISGIDTWAVSLWFKAVEVASTPMLWANEQTTTDRVLCELNTNRMYLATKATNTAYWESTFALDTWHHLVMEKTPGSSVFRGRCWLNGVRLLIEYDMGLGVTPTLASEDLLIGKWQGGLHFEGLIDDIRILDRPILRTEVEHLYNSGSGRGVTGAPTPQKISYLNSIRAIPGANGGTTGALDTTGADLIVIAISGLNTSATPTDSETNTWQALTHQDNYGNQLWYCLNPTTDAAHTFTFSETASYPVISVACYSGVDSYDQESGANTATTGTTYQPGSITPSKNNALFVTSGCTYGGGTDWDSNFSLRQAEYGKSGSNYSGGLADYIQDTAGALNPTWTSTGSYNRSATMATFLPALGGGAVYYYAQQTQAAQ